MKQINQAFIEATYSPSHAFTGGSVLTFYNENLPLKVAPLNQSMEQAILSCDPINSYGSVKQNANATETFEQTVNSLLLRDRLTVFSRFNTLFTELIRANLFQFSSKPEKGTKLIWANVHGDPIFKVYTYAQLESESGITIGENFGDFSFVFNGRRSGDLSITEVTSVINAFNKVLANTGFKGTSPMLKTIKANNNIVTLNGQKIQLGY